jgi:hypothetical protein
MDGGSTRDGAQRQVKPEIILPDHGLSPGKPEARVSLGSRRAGQIHFHGPGLFRVIIALLTLGVAFATAFAVLVGLFLIGILAVGVALAALILFGTVRRHSVEADGR